VNKALKYGAVLIGIYLAVAYASGSGRILSTGSTGISNVVKAFQGR
jgi:hypothetical protein